MGVKWIHKNNYSRPDKRTIKKGGGKKKMRHRTPYWNFWKVVFAGWIVRYPGKVFRIIGIPLGILIVMIYNALTK
jgi:hypothetical protein